MAGGKWVLLALSLLLPCNIHAQQRPLQTDDAELLETGRVRTELGIEFLQRQRYSLSGLEGDLMRLGVASVHVGVGEYAQFEISGVVQNVLSISRRSEPIFTPTLSGDSTSDYGNLTLASKLKLAGESALRPAMSFKFAVELPNTSRESGLGNDQTEFYASLLFKKHLGRSQILANVGLAILGSPILAGRQTDPLTYGIAGIVPLHRQLNLVAEVHGRQGPPRRIGNENKSQARIGVQFWTGRLRWDLGGIAGLMRFDPKSGVVVGMTYEFQAFKRVKPAPRIVP